MNGDALEDWQLALLVEARRYDDPTIVEANEAEDLRDAQELLSDAEGKDNPTVVETEVKKTHDDAEALLDAAKGIDDWEVVDTEKREAEREACEAVRDALEKPLKENHGLRDTVVESMGVVDIVEQFRDEGDEGEIKLESLAQQPETGGGGNDPEDPDPEDPADTLSAEERNEVRDLNKRAERMKDRTPEYSETLRQEAADIMGVDDFDDIDMERL